MRVAMAAALALAFSATGAMAAQQFDLDCKGNFSAIPAAAGQADTPWADHFRVDLTWGEFCQGPCERPKILVTARPEIIVFDANEDETTKDFVAVSRATGEFYANHVEKASGAGWTIMGQCDPAPFTEIPTFVK